MRLPTVPRGHMLADKKLPQVVHQGGPPRLHETIECIWRGAEGDPPPGNKARWGQFYADEFPGQ